jgi:hypothetical protein
MAAIVRDWIIETCETVGTGDLILTGGVDQAQARFRDGIPSGKVWYSIFENGNREVGIGDFNGVDRIVRSDIYATLINGIYVEEPEDPLPLEGEPVVSCTLNAEAWNTIRVELDQAISDILNLNDRVGDLEDGGGLLEPRVEQNEVDIALNRANITTNTTNISTLSTDLAVLDSDVQFRESAVTALETGGLVTQNGPTSITVAAGSGEIIDSYTDTENQNTVDISWDEQVVDLLAIGGLPVLDGLGATEIGIGSDSLVKAFPDGMSASQRRKNIKLATVEYIDQVIDQVIFAPIVSNQIGNIVLDFIDYTGLQSRLKGLEVRPTEPLNMEIWRDIGAVFEPGINYENALDNQNVRQLPAKGDTNTGIAMDYATYDSDTPDVSGPFTVVPSDAYEADGLGVVTVLPNNTVTIHYVIESLANHTFLSYGQSTYPDYATAVNNLFADRATHSFATAFDAMILQAQIIVTKGATQIDTIVAGVYPLGATSPSGSGTGSSAQALDVSYTDTFNLGTNVQVALDSLAALKLTSDQHAAVNAANAPSVSNPFATETDIAFSQEEVTGPAIKVTSSPMVEVPLNSNLAFVSGAVAVSFARETEGTSIDRYGGMHVADIDQPRFEANGLLIEGGTTNYVLDSSQIDTDGVPEEAGITRTSWSLGPNAVRNGSAQSPVVDGDRHTMAYSYSGVTGASGAFVQQIVSGLTAAAVYTASVWIRSDNPAAILAGTFSADGVTTPLAGVVTNKWERLVVEFTASGTSINFFPFLDITVGSGVEIWGAQIEANAFATSFFPTLDVAASRGSDICTMTYDNNITAVNVPWSIAMNIDVIALDPLEVQRAWYSDSARAIIGSHNSSFSEDVVVAIGQSNRGTSHQLTENISTRITLTSDPDILMGWVYVDGVEVFTFGTEAPLQDNNTVTLGSFNGTQFLNGHIKNVKVYDSLLTAFEARMA